MSSYERPMYLEEKINQILQDVNDIEPWAYTYIDKPTDLLEIRSADLQEILRANLQNFYPII